MQPAAAQREDSDASISVICGLFLMHPKQSRKPNTKPTAHVISGFANPVLPEC